MAKIIEITLSPEKDGRKQLYRHAAAKIGVKETDITELKILKRSIDARKKLSVKIVYSAAVGLKNDPILPSAEYCLPTASYIPAERPVIVGFGPAGMFAALALAEAGFHPLIIERGSDVDVRIGKVERFTQNGELDPECNVQFGEGGAGTFSDGKLNTGIGDSRVGFILRRFAEFGAGAHIVYDAAPHVGTDVLRTVVKNIRQHILSLGAEIRFDTRLTDISVSNGHIQNITVTAQGSRDVIPCQTLFLAVGHSARDTMLMLYEKKLPMEAKPFAMGVRIEHRRTQIDLAQYGKYAGIKSLGAASYKLSVHLPSGTGVYTFCMCPGGYVMASASERGGVVTNGMSYSGRAGDNSNSALLVSLNPHEFPYAGPLGGIYWQHEIERKAFEYAGAGYKAPCQLVGDFLTGRESTECRSIVPSYRPGVRYGNLTQVLPNVITSALKEAIPLLEHKLSGFSAADAVLTAPETRSSSPIRILRDSNLQAIGTAGLYPCGEGAGWAGGIVSAASDGLRCCEQYILSLKQ